MASLTSILTEIAGLIEDIDTDANFDYDWGSINQPDQALQTYPSAEIMFVSEEALEGELNVQYGFAVAKIDIKIKCKNEDAEDIPNYAYDDEIIAKLHDVKSVLLTDHDGYLSLTDGDALISYKGCEKILSKSGDRFVPGELLTHWEVKYQDV